MTESERTGSHTMTIASGTLTLDEFLAEYELDAVLEYERGVISTKMPPTAGHGFLAAILVQHINEFAYPRRLAFAAPEIRTTDVGSGISRVPDISVYIWDRIERDPVKRERGVFIPPDIAIEIASWTSVRIGPNGGCEAPTRSTSTTLSQV
jgi:Uma2 family endonuclease